MLPTVKRATDIAICIFYRCRRLRVVTDLRDYDSIKNMLVQKVFDVLQKSKVFRDSYFL